MRLIQQTPATSDFDVILDGEATPAFRILLPEAISADGLGDVSGCHTVPGEWRLGGSGAEGIFSPSQDVRVRVTIECREPDMLVDISVTNTSSRPFLNVIANFCASVNHLPGEPGWCNRAFIPGVSLDRDLQGRYWYSEVAPYGLQALTADGWVTMHPCPEASDPDAVPKYSWAPSARDDVRACAVQSHDQSLLFFQAWDAPCRYAEPFPGNACMHLLPLITARLAPGETAILRGIAGIFRGDWAALSRRIRAALARD